MKSLSFKPIEIKRLVYIVPVFVLFILFACNKVNNETMVVIRDCTGTYLRLDGKDYHVCNPKKISAFVSGTEVKATFKKIKDCKDEPKQHHVCFMLHENEGWITVEKIK